jgi:hypothetical protein
MEQQRRLSKEIWMNDPHCSVETATFERTTKATEPA